MTFTVEYEAGGRRALGRRGDGIAGRARLRSDSEEAIARAQALALACSPTGWSTAKRLTSSSTLLRRGMSQWPSAKARRVIGRTPSHRLEHQTGVKFSQDLSSRLPDVVFAFQR